MPNLSAETRQRILGVAETLFAERDFGKVRMEDIAKEAEVGKVTVYRYFPTKDELYLGLLRQVGSEYLGLLRDAEASIRGCQAKLVALVRAAMGYFDQRPHLIKLLDRAGISTDRQKDFPWLEVQREFFRMLQGLLAEGAARGEFQVDDLELAVRALVGGMRFQLLYPCVEVSREDVAGRLVCMLVRPVAPAQPMRVA